MRRSLPKRQHCSESPSWTNCFFVVKQQSCRPRYTHHLQAMRQIGESRALVACSTDVSLIARSVFFFFCAGDAFAVVTPRSTALSHASTSRLTSAGSLMCFSMMHVTASLCTSQHCLPVVSPVTAKQLTPIPALRLRFQNCHNTPRGTRPSRCHAARCLNITRQHKILRPGTLHGTALVRRCFRTQQRAHDSLWGWS